MESIQRLGTNQPVLPHKSGLSPSDIHVLLVDDERLSRTIVSNLLRRCDYTGACADFFVTPFSCDSRVMISFLLSGPHTLANCSHHSR